MNPDKLLQRPLAEFPTLLLQTHVVMQEMDPVPFTETWL